MRAADWTFDKLKTADDYNYKMYAQTIYKYAQIGANEFANAM